MEWRGTWETVCIENELETLPEERRGGLLHFRFLDGTELEIDPDGE